MTLLEKIKQDNIAARKAKNTAKSALLTTLVSEISNIGKNDGNRETTEPESIAVVKKFIKGVDETLKALEFSSDGRVLVAQLEKEVLESYLPTQLSVEELSLVIAALVSNLPDRSLKQMGAVMKMLKEQYDGQFDGKTASGIIKSQLA